VGKIESRGCDAASGWTSTGISVKQHPLDWRPENPRLGIDRMQAKRGGARRAAGAEGGGARIWDHAPMPQPQFEPDGEAHDILAAEEFAMPTLDPTLHHPPVQLPEDPTGVTEPHDILAAEEFPMPAIRPWETSLAPARGTTPAVPLGLMLAGLLLALFVRRRRARA
jgi:hypothetical protein